MRTPPLLADFIHSRACKPICAKSLTLPGSVKDFEGVTLCFPIDIAGGVLQKAAAVYSRRLGMSGPFTSYLLVSIILFALYIVYWGLSSTEPTDASSSLISSEYT